MRKCNHKNNILKKILMMEITLLIIFINNNIKSKSKFLVQIMAKYTIFDFELQSNKTLPSPTATHQVDINN